MKKLNFLRQFATAMLAVSLPSAATAYQADQLDQLIDMPLESLMQIQVSVASRHLESVGSAPALISVFSHRQIEQMGVTELAELLPQIPGFEVSSNSNIATRTPTLTVRGHHNAQVLILRDGHRINDHNNASPYIFQRMILLDNIERVEVMRGPGSSVHGSAAFVAIINLVSREAPRGITAEVGTHNGKRISAGHTFGGDGWQLSLSGTHLQDDGQSFSGLFDTNGLTDNSRDPRQHSEAQALLRTGNWQARLYHSHTRLRDFYQFGKLGNGSNRDDTRLTMADIEYRLPLSAHLDGRVSVGYRYYQADEIGFDTPAGVGPFAVAPLLIGPDFTHQIYSANADFNYQPNNEQTFSWGLSYERANSPDAFTQANYAVLGGFGYVGGIQSFESDALRFVRDVTREVYGLYGQAERRWHQWTANAGLRYDRVSDVGEALSPKLALTYEADSQNIVKAIYGEAFQAPVMGSLYNQNNPATQGNPDLDPERIRTLSLSWLHEAPARQAEATLFYNHIEDMIQRVPSAPSTTFSNVGEQKTLGLELSGTAQLDRHWRAQAGYTRYLFNDFSASSALSIEAPDQFVSNWLASARLDYDNGPWHLNLNGNAAAASDVLAASGTRLTLNAAAEYRPGSHWRYFLRLHNLLDNNNDSAALGSGLGKNAANQTVRATPDRGFELFAGLGWTY